MLKKEDMVPGTKVIVVDPKEGLPAVYGGSSGLPAVRAWTGPNLGMVGSPSIDFVKGATFEVVRGPKKIGGINLVRVKDNRGEGEMYWCEARVSCKKV